MPETRAANPPVGIGLIGAGMIGQGHAYALRLLTEDGEVRPVAITDFSAEAVDAARGICPFERVAADAQAVIDDPDVEAVVIVTPTTTHRDLVPRSSPRASRCCARSRSPRSFDIVQEMCALVAASGLTAQVGFHSRFHPLINELVRHRRRATSSARRWATRCATTSTGRRATSSPGTVRGVRNARTRAAVHSSNTRSTVPTS